ncbi:hypothetical protein DMB66_31825 [Actinoplanes sp. ATCC 53533]|uniref:hypothetical protein n=1 Tax=Actinoplanes sp. ATCC 53533 TaxID=1288362 RepID=UPI000F795F4B|nr:hypothetical protein [Actinoplanes sp. ATCC 53533]RSM57727.1 hypothetical protein DMB66_31825 [Actinoplanes sp. ATCC 53533]
MRKLWLAVGVNLVLGVPAVVPIFLGWYFLVNGPLAALGWTQPDPDENEGMLPMVIFIVPILCLSGSIWGLVNWWLRRKVAVPAAQYWPACLAASFVPFLALFGLL